MSLDRAQLQARLDAYLAAELRILQSQEYLIGSGATSRRNQRADLAVVQSGIAATRAEIAQRDALTSGRPRGPIYLRPR